MTPSPETMTPRKKVTDRSRKAPAVKPLVTRLYEGTAELRVSIPQKQNKNNPQNPSDAPEQKELIELMLPPLSKSATESELVAGITSLIINVLLQDIESTRTEYLKIRQAEGISRAKAEGKQMGRPKKEFPDAYYDAINLCRAGKISISEGAERSGMTYWAFYANLRRNNRAET